MTETQPVAATDPGQPVPLPPDPAIAMRQVAADFAALRKRMKDERDAAAAATPPGDV